MTRGGPWKPDVSSPTAAATMLVELRVPYLHGPDSGFDRTLGDAWRRLDASEQRVLMHGVVLALPRLDGRTRAECLSFASTHAHPAHAEVFESVIEPWPTWADEPSLVGVQDRTGTCGHVWSKVLLRVFPTPDGPHFSRLVAHAERHGAESAVLETFLDAGRPARALELLRQMVARGCPDLSPVRCAHVFGRAALHGVVERRRLMEVNRLMAGASKRTRGAWEHSLARILEASPELWTACHSVLVTAPPADGA